MKRKTSVISVRWVSMLFKPASKLMDTNGKIAPAVAIYTPKSDSLKTIKLIRHIAKAGVDKAIKT